MKAQLCPVCKGTGDYRGGKCHGCQGKGWVEVHEGDNDYPCGPQYPWYPLYPYPYEPWKITYTGDITNVMPQI